MSYINDLKDELNRLTSVDPPFSIDYMICSIHPHIDILEQEITELKQAVRELVDDVETFARDIMGEPLRNSSLNNPTVKRVMEESSEKS